jgi:hypothetical protein
MELRLPLDYERLPEYWQLSAGLRASAQAGAHGQIELAANFLFLRLFVALGYLARSTNVPGLLTGAGAQQLEAGMEGFFGEGAGPVELLERSGLLVRHDGGWHCPLFAHHNGHLAGNYKAPHVRKR